MEWGAPVGVGFFCFHALEDTKQKKLTPLDRGPPLHVNRVLHKSCKTNFFKDSFHIYEMRKFAFHNTLRF